MAAITHNVLISPVASKSNSPTHTETHIRLRRALLMMALFSATERQTLNS